MSTTLFSLTMTQKGDTRLSEASAPAGTKLQLTHIVLGDNRTPIADLKQTSQIRNEIYRATLDRATVDTTKKTVVCVLLMPENKKDLEVREIGVFEHSYDRKMMH
ncbi:phage tail protein [Candidatus Regiella endosymbiont of Tuberolachnus salignus]|uniref:phage tail-collar fiber domain-containing protein n=1 Tax=Candidatus Regiella endosymbiont of Tuberolachnus salignus TaxID=3077956 RepID=UPI0030CB4344